MILGPSSLDSEGDDLVEPEDSSAKGSIGDDLASLTEGDLWDEEPLESEDRLEAGEGIKGTCASWLIEEVFFVFSLLFFVKELSDSVLLSSLFLSSFGSDGFGGRVSVVTFVIIFDCDVFGGVVASCSAFVSDSCLFLSCVFF